MNAKTSGTANRHLSCGVTKDSGHSCCPAACAARPLATMAPSLLGPEKTSTYQLPSEGRRQDDCLSRRMAFIKTRGSVLSETCRMSFSQTSDACGFSPLRQARCTRLSSLKAYESPPYRLAVHLHAFNFVFCIENFPPNLTAK